MSVSQVAIAAIISLLLELFDSLRSEVEAGADAVDDGDILSFPPSSHMRYPEDIASAAQYPNASTYVGVTRRGTWYRKLSPTSFA